MKLVDKETLYYLISDSPDNNFDFTDEEVDYIVSLITSDIDKEKGIS